MVVEGSEGIKGKWWLCIMHVLSCFPQSQLPLDERAYSSRRSSILTIWEKMRHLWPSRLSLGSSLSSSTIFPLLSTSPCFTRSLSHSACARAFVDCGFAV